MLVIGAGSAGLNAALVLGRTRRRTLLLDHGSPRNAPAQAAHGLFTRDGTSPADLTRIGREQLAPYPVTIRSDQAQTVAPDQTGFTVTLAGGHLVHAQRLLLATGVTDHLPDPPGLREGWGTTVHHCPYCHGWEVRDQALADLIPGGGDLAYHRGVLLVLTGATVPTSATEEQNEHHVQPGLGVVQTPAVRDQIIPPRGPGLGAQILFATQAIRKCRPDLHPRPVGTLTLIGAGLLWRT